MNTSLFSFLVLFAIVYCGPCPDGYAQPPKGGDCFKDINFRDSFYGVLNPKTFDEANTACSDLYSGGMLASIHSPEENQLINNQSNPIMRCDVPNSKGLNIGLRCKGKDCKWDDGSPVIYTKFAGDGPTESDSESCYTIGGTNNEWYRKSCGEQDADCWVCKVKARTIDCFDGEIAYKGGCVSVQTSPLDLASAKDACPAGGKLVSLHGNNEVDFYKKAALDAGVIGSIYIGGQYSNGIFEWIDGSHSNYAHWANGFPNVIFGTCVQMLLDSAFGVQGQWSNIDCSTKQPFFCFRDGASYDPTPVYPKAPARCPSSQYYYLYNKNDVEHMYSPNYPLSIPNHENCEYYLQAVTYGFASVKFTSYDCGAGTSLELYDGLWSETPFLTFTTNCPDIDQYYSATTFILRMYFKTNGTSAPSGTGWEATFTTLFP